jgi:hypothetical protein
MDHHLLDETKLEKRGASSSPLFENKSYEKCKPQ